jgi:tyrosinase
MVNGVLSPGDPLFYLHHTWLDRVFWNWQAHDRAARTTTTSGTNIGPDGAVPTSPRGRRASRQSPRPRCLLSEESRSADSMQYRKPTGAAGDPGTTTTLGHVLNMYGNSPNKTIADVLDIQGSFLCYEYVEA